MTRTRILIAGLLLSLVALVGISQAGRLYDQYGPSGPLVMQSDDTTYSAWDETLHAWRHTLIGDAAVSAWDAILGGFKFVLVSLIEGEDQTNHLLQVSGGRVRQLHVATAVTTNTTSTTFQLPTGEKSPHFQLVCNAGASTDCGIVVELYGNIVNTTSGGALIGTVTLPTGAATTNGLFQNFKRDYAWYYWKTLGKVGTSPVLDGYVHF